MAYGPYQPELPPVRGSAIRLPLLVGIFLGLVGGWMLTGVVRRGPGLLEPRPVTPRGDLAADEKSTIELFERVSPSVVYISSTIRARRNYDVLEIPQGTGSGFVWDRHGHIVTNYHVTAQGTRFKVILADQSSWDAKLAGVDEERDLAVLRIDAPPEKLSPILVGSSEDLRVGQRVFAIGNPFGLDHTLTTGIISALDRTMPTFANRTIQGVIQTDAAINPGNSGGPLLDSSGRLIGVNTSIYSPSGVSAGIGFAVPVNIVREVVPELIEHGRVRRPLLGIQPYYGQIPRQSRLPPGVLIRDVAPDGGAEEAGLRGMQFTRDGDIVLGDLIVQIDGQDVASYDDLRHVLEKHKAGDEVDVTYIREGRRETARVRLQGS